MATQAYVIVIEIPEKKCPNVRGKASLIKDGKAKFIFQIIQLLEMLKMALTDMELQVVEML